MSNIDYRTGYYGTVKTIEDYQDYNEREPDYWSLHYQDRWVEAAKLLNPEVLLQRPKLLDVGCGLGRSLEYFAKYGLEVMGIEPNREVVKIAQERGWPVKQGFIDEVENFIDECPSFDIIHIEQVLSHSSDYRHILECAYKLLKDDGVLIIEEPNDYNPLQMKLKIELGEYWKTLDHVNYFNFKSMSEILEAAGFEVKHKSATYPMELFELSGRHYVGDEKAGSLLHREVTKMLIGMGNKARKKLLDGFAEQGIGRDLIVWAKKKENIVC